MYSFTGIIPGDLIATQPWVRDITGLTPGDVFTGTDQTARDAAATAQERADDAFSNAETAQTAADANTSNVETNADAITALPTPFDWAQEGNTEQIPLAKISTAQRGTKVHVSTSLPGTGLLGDIVILDLTTTSPSIYEWGTSGWQLDYTFQGGRVHVVTAAHDIDQNTTPVANGADILLELVSGTLKLYRRLNASSAPYWQYYGEVMGGGVDQIARDAAAAAAVLLLQTSTTEHYADPNAHHVPGGGAGGPVKIGNWSGDLVGDTWTATTLEWPTTALVGIAAVHTIVFDGVTTVGWPIGWYDSAAVGAHRYNFRLAAGAAFGWIRKTSGGLIELRSGQARNGLSFDFWSL